MTPPVLTAEEIAAIAAREWSYVVDDVEFVPLTVAERDALVAMAQELVTSPPEPDIDRLMRERLLHQVRALTEGKG